MSGYGDLQNVMCTVNLLGRICYIYFQNLDEELELHRQDKSALQRVCMRTVQI